MLGVGRPPPFDAAGLRLRDELVLLVDLRRWATC
jgi:hypothetical protein